MPDRITVILPPVLSDEERIAEALNYSSLTEGDGYGEGSGYGYDRGDGWCYGDGDGDGLGGGDGFSGEFVVDYGDGGSSAHV